MLRRAGVKAKAVDFIAYTVTDMDRAEAFYRDALGLEVSVPRGTKGTRGNGFMEFEVGGVSIGLTQLDPLPNGAMALAVDDVHQAVADLKGMHAEIAMEPIETPVCFMAVVSDPDGNKVILHQRKDGTAG